MRRFILGICLFIGGIICLSTWILASMLIIQPGGARSVIGVLRSTGSNIPVICFFALISVAGLIMAACNLEDKK